MTGSTVVVLLMAAAIVGALVTWTILALTGRHAAAAALNRATPGRREELFRVAFDRAPVGIALVGVDGTWIQINERLLTALSVRREDLLRTTLKELIHPDDRRFEEAQRKRLVDGEIPLVSMDVRLASRSGTFAGFRMNASLCRRGGGEIQCIEYSFDPLPERGTARSPLTVEAAFEHLEDVGLVRLAANGKITGWSRGAEAILGYRRDEIIGKSRAVLYPDSDVAEGLADRDTRETTLRGKFDREASLVGKDGLVASIDVTFIKSPEGGLIAVIRRPVHLQRPLSGMTASQFADQQKRLDESEEARRKAEARLLELESDAVAALQAKSAIEQALVEARGMITRLKEEGERKISELLRRIEVLKNEVRKREGIEQSLRAGFAELQSGGEQTVDELRAVTLALRDEISRRKDLEAVVGELRAATALAPPAAAAPHRLESPIDADSAREWEVLEPEELRRALLAIEERRGSGTVILRHEDDHARVYYEDGLILGSLSSTQRTPIGEQLVERSLITAQQRDRALDIQQQTGIAFGRVLLIMNAVDFDQLFTVMRERASVELSEILSWPHVAFTFADDIAPPNKLVPLRLPLQDIMTPTDADAALMDEMMSEPKLSVDDEAVATVDATSEPVDFEASFDRFVVEAHAVPASNDIEHAADEPLAVSNDPGLPPSAEAETVAAPLPFVGGSSKKSRKYHRFDCRAADRIPSAARVPFATSEEAEAMGYEACGLCVKSRKTKKRA